jgi:poly-gamma-glutamate synthesis protein (capsule biosynthesis protein)
MDWGERGLLETLDTLHATGIRTAGAGRNEREAVTPAVLEIQSRRVLVFAGAHPSSGVPASWAAGPDRAGVNVISDLSTASAERFARAVRAVRQPGDLVIVSLHIGGNWSYEITLEERAFAHDLVDRAGADIVHGHSSHHVRGIEVYGGKLILYGCGDLLNDYEGIGGHETYRPGLALMYFPVVETETGRLQRLVMTPTSTRAFRICRAGRADAEWLAGLLTHEGERFGTRAVRDADDRLQLCWD